MRDPSRGSFSRPWESPDWANKKSKPLKKMIFSITLTCNSHILKSTIEIEEINKKFHVPPLHCSLRGFSNHFPGIRIILHPYNSLQTYSYIICSLFYPPQLTLILWTYYQRSPWFACLYSELPSACIGMFKNHLLHPWCTIGHLWPPSNVLPWVTTSAPDLSYHNRVSVKLLCDS